MCIRDRAYTIRRKVSGYHDEHLSESYSSASAIRRLLEAAGKSIHLESEGLFDEPTLSEALTRLEGQVPPACIRFLEETHSRRYPVYANDLSLLFKYRLLTESRESLVRYQDVTCLLYTSFSDQRQRHFSVRVFSHQTEPILFPRDLIPQPVPDQHFIFY